MPIPGVWSLRNAIVGGRRAGTDAGSGLTCPKYESLVKAFGFRYLSLRKADLTSDVIQNFLQAEGPIILEVFMAPDQLLVPKLSVSITADGRLVSPPLEDLSPLLTLQSLKKNLLVPLHPKSISLDRVVSDSKGDAIYQFCEGLRRVLEDYSLLGNLRPCSTLC